MKTSFLDVPRVFVPGADKSQVIKDWGKIFLSSDEMVSFITASGKEYDLCAKSWGFYATPSINARLKEKGFKTALVKNSQGHLYVMLVEQEQLEAFAGFLKRENEAVVEWLDERSLSGFLCPICGSSSEQGRFRVTRQDKFAITPDRIRAPAEYIECSVCRSMHLQDDGKYTQVYLDGSFYSVDGDPVEFLRKRFAQVIALPQERSDNYCRVSRINAFLKTEKLSMNDKKKVLDIGAGMGVFLHRFLDDRWEGAALEPDSHACRHMESVLPGVRIIQGDSSALALNEQFDLITFNRVLEHIYDPVTELRKLRDHCHQGTVIYIELPDTLSFYEDGPNNEAFGYGHYCVYSPESLMIMTGKAGLKMVSCARVVEPSGKFTLYGFFRKSIKMHSQGVALGGDHVKNNLG
jgi:SAM-dependent methyltransferase